MMGDEVDLDLDEEQLLEIINPLGLAKNGHFDEKELSEVCKFIGLDLPEESINEIFLELDQNRTGKVTIGDLCLMLKGMKSSESEQQLKPKSDSTSSSQKDISSVECINYLRQLQIGSEGHNKSIFSILDPENTGFTKLISLISLWSELGIDQSQALFILKDFGIATNDFNNDINIYELTKAFEEELDSSKELGLPFSLHVGLLNYKTETYYLRSLYENIQCERDKLKSDLYDSNQRSTVIAQEIDEQNLRMERKNQQVIQKLDSKYNEQLQEIQKRLLSEKESMQQCLQSAETELENLKSENTKLKSDIVKQNTENESLEQEVKNLDKEIKVVKREKESMERELTNYINITKRQEESEKRANDKISNYEVKLNDSFAELSKQRDVNDELSSQLEGLRGTIKVLKASEEKYYCNVKRKKGLNSSPMSNNASFGHYEDGQNVNDIEIDIEEQAEDITITSPNKSYEIAMQQLPVLQNQNAKLPTENANHNQLHINDPPKHLKLVEEYKNLESEMDTVKNKIVTILQENEQLKKQKSQLEKEIAKIKKLSSTSTSTENLSSKSTKVLKEELKVKSTECITLREQCEDLESSLDLLRNEYEKCEDYWHGKLQEERLMYEEDRRINDEKLTELDLKIHEYEETFLKDEKSFSSTSREKLPIIDEQIYLEQQITDLANECEYLKKEIKLIKSDHDDQLNEIQGKWTRKNNEDCGRLEDELSSLRVKCQNYESRLALLGESGSDNGSNEVENLKEKVEQLEEHLKSQDECHHIHIMNLERSWGDKEKFYVQKIYHQDPLKLYNPYQYGLPSTRKETFSYNQHQQQNTNSNISNTNKSLIEMVNSHNRNTVSPMSLNNNNEPIQANKPHSLPFIPQENAFANQENFTALQHQSTNTNYAYQSRLLPSAFNTQAGAGGVVVPESNCPVPNQSQSQSQSQPNSVNKKAWCHVEIVWLQNLKNQLKQKEDQCTFLQNLIQQMEIDNENRLAELKYSHDQEISNWGTIMQGSQDLVRKQNLQIKDQTEKLIHSEMLVKDLWMENSKLIASLAQTEQRVSNLEGILKYQQQQHQLLINSGGGSSSGSLNNNNNNNNSSTMQSRNSSLI